MSVGLSNQTQFGVRWQYCHGLQSLPWWGAPSSCCSRWRCPDLVGVLTVPANKPAVVAIAETVTVRVGTRFSGVDREGHG